MGDPIYKNSNSLGSEKTDLILKTSGRILIKTKNKYFNLKYAEESNTEESNTEESNTEVYLLTTTDNEFIQKKFSEAGSNKDILIITGDGSIHMNASGQRFEIPINKLPNELESILINKLTVKELLVTTNNLIQNLNSEFLNGYSSDKFIKYLDNAIIDTNWKFKNSIEGVGIKNSDNSSYLNLSSSTLKVNNIITRKITVLDSNSDQNTGNGLFSISNQVLIGKGAKVISAKNLSINHIPYNENWDVGAPPIVKLILESIGNGLEQKFENLTIEGEETAVDVSKSYYVNLMLDISVDESFSSLITISENDFTSDEGDPAYISYYYRIKNLSEWENISYSNEIVKDSNAKLEIYDNYFDKTNYKEQLSKYKGKVQSIEISDNYFKIGDEIRYNIYEVEVRGLITSIQQKLITIVTNISNSDSSSNQILPSSGIYIYDLEESNYIGKLDGINHSVFGKLFGYGLSSEGNMYFTNPSIAIVNNTNFIKISKEESFFGLTSSGKFLSIDKNGNGQISTNYLNIRDNSFNLNYKNININKDGSGNICGDSGIVWDSSGTITNIPSSTNLWGDLMYILSVSTVPISESYIYQEKSFDSEFTVLNKESFWNGHIFNLKFNYTGRKRFILIANCLDGNCWANAAKPEEVPQTIWVGTWEPGQYGSDMMKPHRFSLAIFGYK